MKLQFSNLLRVSAQLDVPVCQIKEVFPAFVMAKTDVDLHERSPFWTLRFANQRHLRLAREAVALAGIARNAGTDHVFPSR